jgi:hypothetical protein
MAYIQPCASCGVGIESDHSSLPASAVCGRCKGGSSRVIDMTEEELKALGEACAADEKEEGPVVVDRVQEMLERILKLPIEDQLSILQALLDSLDVPEP